MITFSFLKLLLLHISIIALISCSDNTSAPPDDNTQTYPGYNLVWSDEFNKTSLDLTKWNYETGTGVNGDFGTGQIDRATNRIENVSIVNGIIGADGSCLSITTRKEVYIDRNYTSGRINTENKFAWGPGHKIEARIWTKDIKYKGQGFAFWMMPNEIPTGYNYIMWPQGGEIDITEYIGSMPYHNLGSAHYAWFWNNNEYADWNHGHKGAYYSYSSQEVPISNPVWGGYPPSDNDVNAGSYEFHIYGINWLSDRMEFYVDQKIYHIHYFNDGAALNNTADGQDYDAVITLSGKRTMLSEYSNHFTEWHPFEHKMFIILSSGVGGDDNKTYGGAIVPEAVFPASVYVDWVRVYKKE
ncbi:MAG: glycoside hydrolase family 16 protein [Ignavibacteriales bacterium]|nr:glycoside hydrolase family 16 protein [Ignavibacteriales bacterium]